MRGQFSDQGRMFSYASPEERVPKGHPCNDADESRMHSFRIKHDNYIRESRARYSIQGMEASC
jgi:hypothetical protein